MRCSDMAGKLEVWILGARRFLWSLVLGALCLPLLGLLPSANVLAASALSLTTAVAPRAEFRPTVRADDRLSDGVSRRQRPVVPASNGVRGGRLPDLTGSRTGARKAVPITRGQELGFKFRPDEREAPYGFSGGYAGDGAAANEQGQPDSPFRPIPRRHKPTYEELQAEQAAPQYPAMPAMPYPVLPTPPIPGYPGQWPRW